MRVLVIAVIAAIVGGGAVYGVLLYLGQNPVQVSVQLRQAAPSLVPALRRSPTAPRPPTATVLPTAAPPTVSPTATLLSGPAATAAPTPTPAMGGPTERAIVVSAFAACNGRYSGEERRRRFAATNSAIDRNLHSVASVRALVDQNCNRVSQQLAMATTPTGTPAADSPTPTVLNPTFTPRPTPTQTRKPDEVNTHNRYSRAGLESTVHQLINEYRGSKGVTALSWDEELAALARAHSLDMAEHDYYRHVNQAGDDPTDRARKAGYDCRNPLSIGVAENIYLLYGHTSSMRLGDRVTYQWISRQDLAGRFVAGWIASTGHRRNILDTRYTRTGIGVAFGTASGIPHGVYVTQQFC